MTKTVLVVEDEPNIILSLEFLIKEAGYNIIGVDPRNGTGSVVSLWAEIENDWGDLYPGDVHGVLMAPPCTEFSGSGARWWKGKDATSPSLILLAVGLVRLCLRIKDHFRPQWWALENPVGRLPKFIGPWEYTFQPCDYGDPWTKRTCMWGNHVQPPTAPVEPTEGSKHWRLPPSPDRAALRSETPPGFARAFFEANP